MECRGGFVAVELHDDSRRFFAESEDSADLPNESGAALRTELAQSEPLTNFKCLRVGVHWLAARSPAIPIWPGVSSRLLNEQNRLLDIDL